MKIAVLLRGQSRFGRYGAHLFHIMVKDRFPDIEFKIFTNTWKTISTTMTDKLDEKSTIYGREYNQKYLTSDEIYENEIKPWGGSYTVNNDSELFDVIVHGLNYLVDDDDLLKWWFDHTQRYKLSEQETTGSLLAIPGDEWARNYRSKFELFEVTNNSNHENILLKNTAIHMHYLLGQVYSASKSYELLKKYQEENTGYQPDLIWSTRPDAFHWFENESQLRLLIENSKYATSNSNDNVVLVDKVFIHKNYIAMSDYNFYMRPEAAKSFFIGTNFENAKDNLFSLFTKEKHHLLSLIGSGSVLQHALWATYARDCIFVQVDSHLLHKSNILRPSMNFDEFYNLPPTRETFDMIYQLSTEYFYPRVNTFPTRKMISDTFRKLLDN